MSAKIRTSSQIQSYLQRSAVRLRNKKLPTTNLRYYNPQKLEGIQQGIPLFENINMSQIIQIAQKQIEFLVKRGCSNMCTHCYAEAKPEIHHINKNKQTSVLWEDFENMCNGFKELSKRIGFLFLRGTDYVTLFHDCDASSVVLEDKIGKSYDYLDLAEKINEITDSVVLFDTSGWNIQDQKTQKRMEKMVEKAKDTKNYQYIEFNISINPFSPFYTKSLNYKDSGCKEKSEKFRNIYTDRMANVIYTMTPLFEKNNVSFLIRAFENNNKQLAGYQANDLKNLIHEIIRKVKRLYIDDYNTDQKVISSYEQIYKYIEILQNKTRNISTAIGITGRLASNFKDKLNTVKQPVIKNDLASVIDINGKIYFTDFIHTAKSNIHLNYKNKSAETPHIYPE